MVSRGVIKHYTALTQNDALQFDLHIAASLVGCAEKAEILVLSRPHHDAESLLKPTTRSSSQPPTEQNATHGARRSRGAHPSFALGLFRALGLAILPAVLARDKPDRTKVAMRKSRLMSSGRALIHLIPVGGAIALICLNWRGLYLGGYLNNISLLQFAAKLHELTIQASLAAVVFTYVRHELALGVGLPFGALFSGLQISQVSYLWSMEFWGSASSSKAPLQRKLCLILLILVTAALAATAGPASALAMIPRLGYWPAGKTHIWLNGTKDDIWPSFLDDSLVPASCANVDDRWEQNLCPSNGWRSILDYVRYTSFVREGPPSSNWAGYYSPFDENPSLNVGVDRIQVPLVQGSFGL